MTTPAFEAFLARLYVDARARAEFLVDRGGFARAAGLSSAEIASAEAIDAPGLELMARGLVRKKARKRPRRGMPFAPFAFVRKLLLLFSLLVLSCATSPTGRKQLDFVPEEQVDAMGVQAFSELKRQTPQSTDVTVKKNVQRVADAVTAAASGMTDVKKWEVVLFEDPNANAFALPGGKIGVHTGIFKVAKNDAQLATVLAHEVGHVIARHGAERMSEQLAAEGGLALIGGFLGGHASRGDASLIMGALGLGAQIGVLLPFSRAQEAEADEIGLTLMARAGFEPRQSVELWKNMMANAGGPRPPEFLSDHPADEKRIASLQEKMPAAEREYEKTKA